MPENPRDERRRSRSRSPPRRPKAHGGFRWKDKHSSNRDDQNEGDARLDRGYRNQSPRRAYDRDRDRDRERERDRDQDRSRFQDRDRDRDRGYDRYRGNDYQDRYRDRPRDRDTDKPRDKDPSTKKKEKKPKPPPQPTEDLIIVHVNDRLGTKAAIPCLPSDTVGNFKALVAAHIGREPHEILLKRQGERPFKDFISLADYSIGNGVQLDLEVGTGD
ncbi:ubiquitin-related domain-containing protein [Aspergillus spectabilis]